jgi:hypothetical protein
MLGAGQLTVAGAGRRPLRRCLELRRARIRGGRGLKQKSRWCYCPFAHTRGYRALGSVGKLGLVVKP